MKSRAFSQTETTHARSTNRPAQAAPLRKPAGQPSPGSSPSGKRVLLVDDDPTVRDSLNDVLLAEGYFVIPAENGQQALDLANNSAVDLVLLDLNMPVKNGWDTFERLTVEHPLIPIIIITARPNQLFTVVSAGAGVFLGEADGHPDAVTSDGKASGRNRRATPGAPGREETEFH